MNDTNAKRLPVWASILSLAVIVAIAIDGTIYLGKTGAEWGNWIALCGMWFAALTILRGLFSRLRA